MKRMLIKIAFDGTAYHGWQYQPNGITVQETVQKAIEKVLNKKTSVTGCSRTDAGVHASQFCFHIDCDDSIPESAFLQGLNSCLPDDISVIDCVNVAPDFHARYSCKSKRYVYRFYFGNRNPFLDRYALQLIKKPVLEPMNEFCATLLGKHDFKGFSSSHRTVEDTVRTVFDCTVSFNDDLLIFDITADGFLYNMVRILAGTALQVGYKKLPVDIAQKVFDTGDRSLGGETLAPKGLFLKQVNY